MADVASTAMEGGIKRFKYRMCGAGMRWASPALDRMLVLRAAFMADTFDDLSAAASNRPNPRDAPPRLAVVAPTASLG